MAAPRDDLELLLDPLTPEEFLSQYWQKRPLHIPGKPDKFEGIFKPSELLPSLPGATKLRAMFPGPREQLIQPDQVRNMFLQGATICATHVDLGHARLARFADNVRHRLHYAGRVGFRAYYSPVGKGFGLHFDARIATTLQILGSKRWWYSKTPAIPFPKHNSTEGEYEPWERWEKPDESTLASVLLKPGDVLCLPAACWHRAEAEGGESLALNLAFEHEDNSALDLLLAELRARLVSNPKLREPLPPVLLDEAHAGELPKAIARRFQQGASALERELRGLGELDLNRLWRSALVRHARAETQTSALHPSLSPEDALQRTRPGRLQYGVVRGARAKKEVAIFLPADTVSLPARSLPFVTGLAAHPQFVAGEAQAWSGTPKPLSWPATKELLAMLVSRKVLTKCLPPA